jgi:hypothetical protein
MKERKVNLLERVKEVSDKNSDSVVGLKLVTGEFIMGVVTNSGLSGQPQWLTKPIMLAIAPQGGVHFLPWVISSDDNYELAELMPHTITVASVPDNLVQAYMENTGQRRVLAPAGARGEPKILVN